MARGVPRSDRGSFYVWSRDGSFPVVITHDFTEVARFAHALPEEKQAIEEAARTAAIGWFRSILNLSPTIGRP